MKISKSSVDVDTMGEIGNNSPKHSPSLKWKGWRAGSAPAKSSLHSSGAKPSDNDFFSDERSTTSSVVNDDNSYGLNRDVGNGGGSDDMNNNAQAHGIDNSGSNYNYYWSMGQDVLGLTKPNGKYTWRFYAIGIAVCFTFLGLLIPLVLNNQSSPTAKAQSNLKRENKNLKKQLDEAKIDMIAIEETLVASGKAIEEENENLKSKLNTAKEEISIMEEAIASLESKKRDDYDYAYYDGDDDDNNGSVYDENAQDYDYQMILSAGKDIREDAKFEYSNGGNTFPSPTPPPAGATISLNDNASDDYNYDEGTSVPSSTADDDDDTVEDYNYQLVIGAGSEIREDTKFEYSNNGGDAFPSPVPPPTTKSNLEDYEYDDYTSAEDDDDDNFTVEEEDYEYETVLAMKKGIREEAKFEYSN